MTRIAAGRVNRGLPAALQRCGYRTISLYPARHQFGNGVDPGPRERGYQIAAVKRLERRKRKMRFERDKSGDT
ncbi:MAG: hypothetical protein WB689_32255, partial [Xanthobacteraceae bacterium]